MALRRKLLLGIDVGTTGCKCTVYDLEGSAVSTAYRTYSLIHPFSGGVEEDPSDWWNAVVLNCRELLSSTELEASDIEAIGVSCTNTIVPVDRSGNPLYNAIMQLDQRTVPEVEWIKRHVDEERVFEITGNRIAPGGFSFPTIAWLKRNRPDVCERAYKYLVPSGFIVCQLTGEFTINASRMATTMLGEITTGQWSEELLDTLDMPLEKLPRPCKPTEIVGHVSRSGAEQTGLKEGTPVVGGAMDTVTAAVGAGSIFPGSSSITMGTVARFSSVKGKPVFDDRFLNCSHVFDDTWLSIAAVNGAGGSMRWFRDTLGNSPITEAMNSGKDGYVVLDEQASRAKAGSGGVLYLPYLPGERSPIWDPYARGVFFGLKLETGYKEIARSVMEGVAYAIRHNLEIWEEAGHQSNDFAFSGGGAKSALWTGIVADVLGKRLVPVRVRETETLGCAILAGMGTGLIKETKEDICKMVKNESPVAPNPANKEVYDEFFALYKKLYVDLKEDFCLLDKIVKKTS